MLPWAEYWYNTSFNTATGVTPFFTIYGRHPPTLLQYCPQATNNEAVEAELHCRDEALQQLKLHLVRAQNRMKMQADKHRIEKYFCVNDWVFVKLQPYRQSTIRGLGNPKLSKRYFGPFSVMKRIGEVAYQLDLPEGSRIHPVFHISLLKKVVGWDPTSSTPLIVPFTAPDSPPEPLVIIDQRIVVRNGTQISQYLVQWKGMAPDDSSWVDSGVFHKSFPTWNLEDKVPSQGDVNVTTMPEKTLPNKASTSMTIRRSQRARVYPRHLDDYATPLIPARQNSVEA